MSTRREFLKNTGYAAPVILSMTAKPAFAGTGSDRNNDSSNANGGTPSSNGQRNRRSRFGKPSKSVKKSKGKGKK
jgi:hypothetical protein